MSRVRNWCITCNMKDINKENEFINWIKINENVIELWPKDISNFLVFQLEKGENETLHIQAYIELNKAMTLSSLISHLTKKNQWWTGVHIEECRKEKASIAYCIKQETRFLGPWKFGTPKEQGKRTDIKKISDNIINEGLAYAIREDPDMYIKYHNGMNKLADFIANDNAKFEIPNVTIIFGPGGLGKTKYVYDKYKYNEVARAMYAKNGENYKIWFQNYMYQPAILFDEFSPSKCPIDLLKIFTDGHPCDLDVKTTSKTRYNCKDIFIISNQNPKSWYEACSDIDRNALYRRITNVIEFNKKNEFTLHKTNDFFNLYKCTEVD